MIDSNRFERLRRLDVAVSRRVEGLLQGDHRGLLPGPGRTPGEARPYVPGDDVRRIDWNVTARSRRPYVRDTEADHELETTLLIDTSPSMDFGTALGTKSEVALAVAAVYGFATVGGGNRVGAVLVGDGIRRIPARPGRAHLYRILGAASQPFGRRPAAGMPEALLATSRLQSRRGLMVVVSDFLDDGWERPLRMLSHRHEVVACPITDVRELELPDVGVVRMEDAESGRQRWVDTSSRRFRRDFARAAAARSQETKRALVRAGALPMPLRTDRDWIADIVTWVLGRRRSGTATGRSA